MSPSKAVSESDASNVQEPLSSAASGTSYLIFIQLVSRVLTFGGNQILLRFLSPEVLGIAFQLELYSVTVLYFSRESLRVALQRQPQPTISPEAKDALKRRGLQTQTIVNASYVALAIGLPLTAILGFYVSQKSSAVYTPWFQESLQLYALATVLEILSEPAFVVIQERSLYRDRATSETVAACVKCFMACLCAFVCNQLTGENVGVLPFAIGQLAYGVFVFRGYLLSVRDVQAKDQFSLRLKEIQSRSAALSFDKLPETNVMQRWQILAASILKTNHLFSILYVCPVQCQTAPLASRFVHSCCCWRTRRSGCFCPGLELWRTACPHSLPARRREQPKRLREAPRPEWYV